MSALPPQADVVQKPNRVARRLRTSHPARIHATEVTHMNFRIRGLEARQFDHLFALSDAERPADRRCAAPPAASAVATITGITTTSMMKSDHASPQTRSEATEILRLLNGRLARVQIGGTKQTIPVGKLPHGMTTRSGCLQPSAITRKSHHKPNSMPPATAGP